MEPIADKGFVLGVGCLELEENILGLDGGGDIRPIEWTEEMRRCAG